MPSSWQCNPCIWYGESIYGYVNRKRKEGKKRICALDHAARKFCNIIFSMMKSKAEFRPETISTKS